MTRTYLFHRPATLTFTGGRWDGLVIESPAAPAEILIRDDDGNGTAFDAQTVHPVNAAWMTRYVRRSACKPPICYRTH